MTFTVCCSPKVHQDKRSILTAIAESLVKTTKASVEIHCDEEDEDGNRTVGGVFLSPDGKGGVKPTHG